jgi:hypothetical protein
MAWTEITQRKYRRDGLRYASHLTDAEWALIALPLPPASPLGCPRETDLRSAMNAILYITTKDLEATIASAVAWVLVSPIRALTQRIAHP